MEASKEQQLAALFRETGLQHHEAFRETDGFDPEWPLWYSDYLKESLPVLLGKALTRSRIIYELIGLADTADVSQEPWAQVYAKTLLNKYS